MNPPNLAGINMRDVIDAMLSRAGKHSALTLARHLFPEMTNDDLVLWFTTRRSGPTGRMMYRTRGDVKRVEHRRERLNNLLAAGALYVDQLPGWTAARVHSHGQQETAYEVEQVRP